MAISIVDDTTHFTVQYATDDADKFPKNSAYLERRGDKFRFVNGGDNSSKLGPRKFDVSEVTAPLHAEVLATGSVSLDSGASGSVDSITVNGVEVMSGAESFDTSLIVTATAVAANITAHTSTPNYTAASGGTDTVTITAVAGSGNTPNAFTVVSTATTIGTTDTDFSGGISQADALETAVEAIIFS
jgi:hypothetical protein